MKIDELISLRLYNQRLSKTDFKKPNEWFRGWEQQSEPKKS